MTEKSVRSFINFHYQPLTVSQISKRLIVVMVLGIACCLLGPDRYVWAIGILIPILLIIGIMLYVLRVGIHEQNSKFLWDGVTYTYISIILNLTSYRILTWECGYDLTLLFSMLLFLLLSFAAVGIMVWLNIRSDRYNGNNQISGKSAVPYLLSLIGFLFVRHSLDALENQTGIQIIAMALVFLSALIGVGWANLIKLVLNSK